MSATPLDTASKTSKALKATASDLRDPAAEPFSAGAETGKTFRPTRHYLKFADALGDGWGRKCGGYARRNAGTGQKAASIHGRCSGHQRHAPHRMQTLKLLSQGL